MYMLDLLYLHVHVRSLVPLLEPAETPKLDPIRVRVRVRVRARTSLGTSREAEIRSEIV